MSIGMESPDAICPNKFKKADCCINNCSPTAWQYAKYNSDYTLFYGMQELDGLVAHATNDALDLGRELTLDWDMEAVGTSDWQAGASATLTKEAGNPGGSGSQVLRIAYNGFINPSAQQVAPETPSLIGKDIDYGIWLRCDATRTVLFYVGDGPIFSQAIGTSWTFVSGSYGNIVGSARIRVLLLASAGWVECDNVSVRQTGIQPSSAFPGAELLTNGDLNFWTGTPPNDTPDDFLIGGTQDATNFITEVAGGARLVSDGTAIDLRQLGVMEIGKRFRVNVVLDSVTTGAVKVYMGVVNGAYVSPTMSNVGDNIFELESGGDTLYIFRNIGATDVVIRSITLTEVNPLDADIYGADVGQFLNKRLENSYYFDGVVDYVDNYSVELNSIFNPLAGTLTIYALADTWAVGIDYILNLSVDANNGIFFYRSGTDLIVVYLSGGVSKTFTIPSGSPTTPFMLTLTWENPGDVIAYYNASPEVAQVLANPLIGNLDPSLCVIGALNTTPTNSWLGNITLWELAPIAMLHDEIYNQARYGGVV